MCDRRHYGLKISAPNSKDRRGAAVYQKQQLNAASQLCPSDANHCAIGAFDCRRHAERDVGAGIGRLTPELPTRRTGLKMKHPCY